MPGRDPYAAGWLDSSVEEFVTGLPNRSRSTSYALVTALDSNTDLRSFIGKPPLQDGAILGKGILLPTTSLREHACCLFAGFDEVWFFPEPINEEKPDHLSIVGPRRIDRAALDDVVGWMARNRCTLALGDGVGLNVVLKAHGWLRYVLALSLRQRFPDPEVRQEDGEWVVTAD